MTAPLLDIAPVARLVLRSRALKLADAHELDLAIATMFPIVLCAPEELADTLGREGFRSVARGPTAVREWINTVQRGAGF